MKSSILTVPDMTAGGCW